MQINSKDKELILGKDLKRGNKIIDLPFVLEKDRFELS
jgi:hypothetical protein